MASPAELRPLSLGELLDHTFSLYRHHFLLFVGLMAAPYLLLLGVTLLLDAFTQTSRQEAAAGMLAAVLVLVFVILIGSLIVYGLTQAATVFAVSEVHLGRTTTIREAYNGVWGDIGRVIFIQILIGFGTFIGLLLLIYPGVWFLLRSSVAIPVAVVEDLHSTDAIRRSIELTKGFTGRVLLILVLMIVINWVAAVVFQFPLFFVIAFYAAKGGQMPLWVTMLSRIGESAATILAGPLATIAFALLYFDLRVRKEAFDLKLMMDTLEHRPSEPTPRFHVS